MSTTATSTDRKPDLSVVVASVNGPAVLEPTLDSLDALPERDRLEVVVVDTLGGASRERLLTRDRPVVIVDSPRLSIPRLRYLGVQKTQAPVVALIEDHTKVDLAWARTLLHEHRNHWGAVGGPVENGKPGVVNWAVYFCEYANYMAPLAEGETADLPGNNIAYKRHDLMRHASVLDEGKWESWINDRLRADGIPIAASNAMVVRHIKPFRLGYFLRQRFHFSRSYAGMRRADQTFVERLVYGVGSLTLPAILMARVTRTVLAKKRNLGKFVSVSPLVVLFMTVGACGEMVGYLFGSGDSLEKVE